jgi:hypothetical protein
VYDCVLALTFIKLLKQLGLTEEDPEVVPVETKVTVAFGFVLVVMVFVITGTSKYDV